VAYLCASLLTAGAASWAVWWMTTGHWTAALLPIALAGVGAEAVRRTADPNEDAPEKRR
jgi:hypothetical protein